MSLLSHLLVVAVVPLALGVRDDSAGTDWLGVDTVDAGILPCHIFVFGPSCKGCLADEGCAWVTKKLAPADELNRNPADFSRDLRTLTNYEGRAARAASNAIHGEEYGECIAHDAAKFAGHYVAVRNTSQAYLGNGEVRLVNPKMKESFGVEEPVVCNELEKRIQKDLVMHPWVARKEKGDMTMTTLETAVETCKKNPKDRFFEKRHLLQTQQLMHVIIDAPFDDNHIPGKTDAQIVEALTYIKPLRWGSDQGDFVDPIHMVIAKSQVGKLAAIYIHSGRHRAVAAYGRYGEIPVQFQCNAKPGDTFEFSESASEVVKANFGSTSWIPFDFARETIRDAINKRTRKACERRKRCG